MRKRGGFLSGVFLLGNLTLILSVAGMSARGEGKPLPTRQAYSLARETALEGRVVSYMAASKTPPRGAHVMLQTASGAVDVHVGSDKLLQLNRFTLAPGDSVRILGETLPYGQGTVFVARVIQKGSQSLAVRSLNGALLRPWKAGGQTQQEGAR
jgi:hypothetical protein